MFNYFILCLWIRLIHKLFYYLEFEVERIGANYFNNLHTVETIGLDMNETKQLIDEISIDKLLLYNQDGVYLEVKREVSLDVYESSFLKYFTQLCTNKINVMYFSVYLPTANTKE